MRDCDDEEKLDDLTRTFASANLPIPNPKRRFDSPLILVITDVV